MKSIPIPKSTSECDTSPSVEIDETRVNIIYGGANESVLLSFNKVYGFKYTDCEYINTLEYSFGLVEIENSQWISEFLDAWTKRGRPIEESFGREASRIHHYRLCFDEYGMYDILCKEFCVGKLDAK